MKSPRITSLAHVIVWAAVCHASPVLPTLFSDHMVLQQRRPIHVWGNASSREKIKLTLAGRTEATQADTRGRWSVYLPALSAGGPFTLTITGNEVVSFRDVMIGEVWVASGQSNMTFPLEGADGSASEVPAADYPQIRLFTVPKRIALSPQENTLPAAWQVCTPDTAKKFSAVGYFFARDLHRHLNVPLGVIESAWPGTTIEEWIEPDVLRADPDSRSLLQEWDHSSPAVKKFAEQPLPFELEFDDFELIPASAPTKGKILADFEDGISHTTMGGSFSYSWADAPGTTVDLVSPGRSGSGFALRVAGRLDGAQDSTLTVHYNFDRSPVDLSVYAGIRFWVRGSGSFRLRSSQPTITDYDDYSTPVLKATDDWQPVTAWFRDLRQDGWGVVKPFTQAELLGFSIENLTTLGYASMPASALYQGMITPLLPYSFRGVIWYQGESNALRAHQYRRLLSSLIGNWRGQSKNENLEFLIVQLPNHGASPAEPGESALAELREAQLSTVMNTPHTGLAVTIDVGDPKDVHPHRKLEVGQRLALWALGTTYGKAIDYSAPLYESMDIAGTQIRIHFSHVGSGLEAHGGGRLQGFSVAGADRKFHWADAQVDGDTVVVSSRDVTGPVAVRYGWADSPLCNLFNKAGLPASPFRTDDWPGITGVP